MRLLEQEFEDDAQFYTKVPLFFQDQTKIINYVMIHPSIGIILFNFFNYSAEDLHHVTASAASANDKSPDIQAQTDKNFLRLRLNESSNKQNIPIHSLLICTQLDEEGFDKLDKSFHELIPKDLSLFKDSSDYKEKVLKLADQNNDFDLDMIRLSLFSEFTLPGIGSLISVEQQKIMHFEINENILIQGIPGSGKSSVLIAKSLYEKMKNPHLSLIIFAPRSCSVHLLQALIFKFIEKTQWGLNPAEIRVSNFESIQKRIRDKERYDLIACDDINQEDLLNLKSLLKKEGHILATSHYKTEGLSSYNLDQSFRLSPALCAACEGVQTQELEEELVIKDGNTYMNTILILEKLLKVADANNISIVHYDSKQKRDLCAQINEYFTPISYLFDDPDRETGIMLYPLSHIGCLQSPYIIIIVDVESEYDPVKLISRASKKSFILGESEAIYNIISKIKGRYNELN